jgi:hypothetical protein
MTVIDQHGLPRYNRGMRVKQRIIEDPRDYLPVDWRYAALFFAYLVVAGIAILAAG